MEKTNPPLTARTPTMYRLPPDRAEIVRTDPPVNLTILECAEYCRVSPRKIRELVATRQLKHGRVGNRIIIRRRWADELLGE